MTETYTESQRQQEGGLLMTRFEILRVLVIVIAFLLALESALIATGFYIVYNDIEEIQSIVIEEVKNDEG